MPHTAYVFDAYGTLFDVHSAVSRLVDRIGPDASAFSELWRGKQLEYADKRNSPCVIIQGSDERAKGEVTIKDLIEGAKAAAAIKDNKEWKEARPAQFSVSQSHLVQEVHNLIKRHQE